MFLASSQTAPHPLSSFDTHPKWQPVTHSARSRRSYGKIGDCEQSNTGATLGKRCYQLAKFDFHPFDPYHWKIAMQLIACLLCRGTKSYLVSVTTWYQNLKTL